MDVIATNPGAQVGTLSGGFTYEDPSVRPVPELPTGVLLGTGIAGIGVFILIRRKKTASNVG